VSPVLEKKRSHFLNLLSRTREAGASKEEEVRLKEFLNEGHRLVESRNLLITEPDEPVPAKVPK
jgi:hypothetical protein